MIDVFPPHQQQQIRMQLSVNLVGVVSQTLVKTKDGKGRVAAFETLVGISSIRSMIREAKTHQITSLLQTGMKHGMMTLDQSLAGLVKKGLVDYESALAAGAEPCGIQMPVRGRRGNRRRGRPRARHPGFHDVPVPPASRPTPGRPRRARSRHRPRRINRYSA